MNFPNIMMMRTCTAVTIPGGLTECPGFMTIALLVLDPARLAAGILSSEIDPDQAPSGDEQIDPDTGVPRAILKAAIATIDLGALPLHQTADERLWTPDTSSLNSIGRGILDAISSSYAATFRGPLSAGTPLPAALLVSVTRPRLTPESNKYTVN